MNNYETRKDDAMSLLYHLTVSFDGGHEALTTALDSAPAVYTDPECLGECKAESVWYDEVAPVRDAESAAELDKALANLVTELRGFGWAFLGADARATLDKLAAL